MLKTTDLSRNQAVFAFDNGAMAPYVYVCNWPDELGGGGEGGGLTDVQLRAAPIQVEGEFFPESQLVTGPLTDAQLRAVALPISAAALPLPAGAATAAKQDTLLGYVDNIEGLLAGTLSVAGAFYPATQPISGSVGITGSVAVTGNFWQTTQPVSLAVLPSLPAGANNIGDVDVLTLPALPAGTNNIGDVDVLTLPALPAGANNIGRVVDQIQNNRVTRNFILDAFTAAPVAEAMQSVAQWYANAAVGATASPAVVPAGKILRLTGGRIETKSLATVGSVIMRVRANASGTAVIGSPVVASAACGSNAGSTTVAMTGGHDHAEFSFGEGGLEFPAGTGVGFSLAGYGPTGTLALQGVTRFEVYGYEYTP